MNVVIAGGSGFIGRRLASSLAADGNAVTVLTRGPAGGRGLPENVRLERWDGRELGDWARTVDGAGAIVNLAGQSIAGEDLLSILFRRWTPKVKQGILQSRLDAGRVLARAVESAQHRPGVFVQASGVDVYGRQARGALPESSPAGTDFLAQVAVAWEDSSAAVESLGVRRAVIRTSLVLDRRGGILPIMLLPFRLYIGGPLGSGEQIVPWIHLQDQVRAIRFLIDSPEARGAFNLVAPETITNRDFGRAIGRAMRRPAGFPTPAFALRMVLGEKSSLVLGGMNPIPARLDALGFRFQFPRAADALQDILA